MTICEKILADKSGGKRVLPDQTVFAEVDLACVDDVQISIFREKFDEISGQVWDREKAVVISDHYLPPSNIQQAESVRELKKFGIEYGLRHVFLNEGIKHQVFRDWGLIVPGSIIAGTDSHMNTGGAFAAMAIGLGPTDIAAIFATGKNWFKVPRTIKLNLNGNLGPMIYAKDLALALLGKYGTEFARYKSIEFSGPLSKNLLLSDRMTLCNMSTEMGAKCAFFEFDVRTKDYAEKIGKSYTEVKPDEDATYENIYSFEAFDLKPQIAIPGKPSNVYPVSTLEGTEITQAYIGTCTNGNFEDLVEAAKILKGRRVHPAVKLIIIPASRSIYTRALEGGLLKIFMETGAIICNPNCGPCVGMHQGILASNDILLSTQNRNFKGRAGSINSQIYLASPATVAVSAIEGKITDPIKFLD
jgi:3-isopropylmalate dehydratase large subunit